MSEDRTQPSRRTVTKGVAWSVPAVTLAAAAPATAASSTCTYTLQWVENTTSGTQEMMALSPDTDRVLRMRFTSTLTSGTGAPENMTVASSLRGAGTSCRAYASQIITRFQEPGLMLSQFGTNANCSGGTTPSQTVTMQVLDSNGNAVPVSGGSMDIADISAHVNSQTPVSWRGYHDEVRFSETATVTGIKNAPGDSAGSAALQQSSGTSFYVSNEGRISAGTKWAHGFSFEQFPETLTYTGRSGRVGLQFIQIRNITFAAPC